MAVLNASSPAKTAMVVLRVKVIVVLPLRSETLVR
jgi:hypothetical protein